MKEFEPTNAEFPWSSFEVPDYDPQATEAIVRRVSMERGHRFILNKASVRWGTMAALGGVALSISLALPARVAPTNSSSHSTVSKTPTVFEKHAALSAEPTGVADNAAKAAPIPPGQPNQPISRLGKTTPTRKKSQLLLTRDERVELLERIKRAQKVSDPEFAYESTTYTSYRPGFSQSMRGIRSELAQCNKEFSRRSGQADIHAVVELEITGAPNLGGLATDVMITLAKSADDRGFRACLTEVFMHTRFPAPLGINTIRVHYPLVFPILGAPPPKRSHRK